jgi:ABC-type lipoprotein export system ATPase subunit
MIQVTGVFKRYRQGSIFVEAVKKTDMTIERGQRVLIYGPSGAGKSTFLNMLGGLSRPSGGKIVFNGTELYRVFDSKRARIRNVSFGFVFQFYHLLPELDVTQNIMLPAMIKGELGRKKIKNKAEELIDMVGLKDRRKHKPKQLSGGEGQRTAIARALVNSPEILFCDEPTGNLDTENSRKIYSLIRDISERDNMTVIAVSHQEVDRSMVTAEYEMVDGILKEGLPLNRV